MTALALTFDDGPDARGTPALLDALARDGVRATFFVIAPRAAAHPELVARTVEAGHTIGLHCDDHVRHCDRSRSWVSDDTQRALERLDRLDLRPALWRTPWGVTAPWTRELADGFGLRLVGWDVDTHDWRGDAAAEMFTATREGLRPGAIVLAHDGIGPGARRHECGETAALVALVADHARAHDLPLEALT